MTESDKGKSRPAPSNSEQSRQFIKAARKLGGDQSEERSTRHSKDCENCSSDEEERKRREDRQGRLPASA